MSTFPFNKILMVFKAGWSNKTRYQLTNEAVFFVLFFLGFLFFGGFFGGGCNDWLIS